MSLIIKDNDLLTVEAISDRIANIERQIEKAEKAEYSKLGQVRHHSELSRNDAKIMKLNERKEILWVRRSKLLRGQ